MKATLISIFIALALIVGVLLATTNNAGGKVEVNNVSIVDGKQIVEVSAKGGYQPRKSLAKAGVPTVLRFETSGTFDCSSAIRIPSLNISQTLPRTGITDIDLGTQEVGLLKGSCGMGMYNFEVDFQG